MNRKKKAVLIFHGLNIFLFSMLLSCTFTPQADTAEGVAKSPYLNHHDSAYYTGKESCRDCHYQNYTSYLRTGMGRSFGLATPSKSASVIGADSVIYDAFKDFYYRPFWRDTLLMVKEFRLEGKDTVHQRTEKVDYIVGSGHHTNSHIFMVNGYAYQIPFTYYTQQQRFDLPPGFEGGANFRFSRYLALECISCHNGLPALVMGSQNKYSQIPLGIDCERCHGPGSIHVNLTKRGVLVDTSVMPDYAIVNPARLPKQLQNDICARCHLQGTMVLKNDKSFYDFKPGMALTEVLDVFMPAYEGGTPTLIMASHFERMSESKCYLQSKGDISCIQCHNPHISVEETDPAVFNKVCTNCHSTEIKHQPATVVSADKDNCVKCHMIKRDSRDIPHVKITDHKISLPDPEIPQPLRFKGLVAVNNRKTDRLTMGRGYLREYESFYANPIYLDSAYFYLLPHTKKTDKPHFKAFVQYFFLTKNLNAIRSIVDKNGVEKVLDEWLVKQDYENDDAWAAYRVGKAFEAANDLKAAWRFYSKATKLAPYFADMMNQLGGVLVAMDSIPQARKVFGRILAEHPRNDKAWVNHAYCESLTGNDKQAVKSLEQALKLNPDNIQALLNLAGIRLSAGEREQAAILVKRVLKREPGNTAANELKRKLGF